MPVTVSASSHRSIKLRKLKKHLLVSIAVITAVVISSAASKAQDEEEHHHHRHHGGGGFGSRGGGGWGGSSMGTNFAAGVVPSIVADVLLVPSLTKPQQTKVRTLYLAYRTKALNRLEVMSKLRSPGGNQERGESDSGGGGDITKDSLAKERLERKRRENVEAGMEASSENMRRTLFMSMMKESEKFQQDMLAVLTEKQTAELKEIAGKAGSPDYFTKRHYDFMNSGKSNAPRKHAPD